MTALLLVVFILQLVIHLVNTVGASTVTNLAWIVYSKLPTNTSKQAQESVRLRNEAVRLKRELNATSAQDEFSKWAKLRRQHDKAMSEHDKISKELGSFKTQFDSTVKILRWLATNGMRLALQMWFQKQPMFWIPKGWVPYYIEWLLSFPRAPVGGISIQVWTNACGAAITLVSMAIASVWALILERTSKVEAGEKGEPVKMQADSKVKAENEKKEL